MTMRKRTTTSSLLLWVLSTCITTISILPVPCDSAEAQQLRGPGEKKLTTTKKQDFVDVVEEEEEEQDAAMMGFWEGPYEMPNIATGIANLPDGRLLTWSAYYAFYTDGPTSAQNRTWTSIFDPSTGVSTEDVVYDSEHNMFCPGIAILPDSRVMITGGWTDFKTSFYDPHTNQWAKGQEMNIARGYQSMVTMRDGSVFTLGGSWSGGIGNKDGEIWNARTERWKLKPGILSNGTLLTHDVRGEYRTDNHMWLFAAPYEDDLVFHAGPAYTMHWIDLRGRGSVQQAGIRGERVDRMNGNAVMYDTGMILTLGGSPDYGENDAEFNVSSPATNHAYVIDINDKSRQRQGEVIVTQTGSMHYPRSMCNSVVLPTGEVVVIGGMTSAQIYVDTNTVYAAELWNPTTGQWTLLANMTTPRNYHATAILGKDGRIIAAGGGLCPVLPCPANHGNAEIFTPPYLLNAADGTLKTNRPVIESAPAKARPGTSFIVTMDTDQEHTFALVRMAGVTHSTTNEYRRVPLPATRPLGSRGILGGENRRPGQFELTIPRKATPPGSYFLFAMNEEGTPSVAAVVNVESDFRPRF